jgi:hypothetical protein
MHKNVKTIYNVITEFWKELHDECMTSNPVRESKTLGQILCDQAYYGACNGYEYAQTQLSLLVKGNPNHKMEINRLSMSELVSMYKTNHLDFYETAIEFRTQRIDELNEQLKLEEEIKGIIEKFSRDIGWTLGYTRKSKVKSQKSVDNLIVYSQDIVEKISNDLKQKGLL